jgi:hypothetical protein
MTVTAPCVAENAALLPYPPGAYAMLPVDKPIPQAVLDNRQIVGVYLQFTWRAIEKKKNVYHWTGLDERVQEAEAAGLKIVLSIRTGLYGAPNWLKQDSAVQTVKLTDTNKYHKDTYGKELTLPVFWDPVFHEARKRFIRAVGQRYAHKDAVVAATASFANYFTDDWAVPHATGMVDGMKVDQVAQWLNAGYTTDKMLKVGREILDTTAAAFPRQSLKLPINVTHPKLDGTATALAEGILDYGYSTYPTRFYAQFNSLHTRTPAASASEAAKPKRGKGAANERQVIFNLLKQHSPQIGLQMLAAASNGEKDNCRQNGNQSPCPEQEVLQKSVELGLTYRPVFIEFWREDASNSDLAEVLKKATEGVGGKPR